MTPPFIPQPFAPNGVASGFRPQFPMSNEYFDPRSQFEQQQQHQSPLKRLRSSEPNQFSHSTPYPPPPTIPRTLQPLNPPINRGSNNIFFKTKLCENFGKGQCQKGDNCNFAHGEEDLRQPHPDWQRLAPNGKITKLDNDEQIIQRLKLCKKFCNGELCPFGEKCNFLHEDLKTFKDHLGRFRDISAISNGVAGPTTFAVNGNMPEQIDNKFVNNNAKSVFWKTRLCSKYETDGHCPFNGNCDFAHGTAELQMYQHGVPLEGESGNCAITIHAKPIITAPFNISVPSAPSNTVTGPNPIQEGSEKRFLKLKKFKKLNGIYGDWIDDSPLHESE